MFYTQPDTSANRRSWNDKLGKCDFTLAFILLLDQQNTFEEGGAVSRHLPNPNSLIAPVHNFTSWIVWGRSEDESSSFSTRSTVLALILLKHGQFDAVEVLLHFFYYIFITIRGVELLVFACLFLNGQFRLARLKPNQKPKFVVIELLKTVWFWVSFDFVIWA